ncbi:MAG: hypothetical protein EBX41_09975, partial [Chitinophagia bacterium]|nr:hypothetical protein [Chitinophagia bacterium]
MESWSRRTHGATSHQPHQRDTVPTTPAEQAPIPAEPMPTPAEANPLTPPIPSQQAGAMPAVPEPKKSRKKIFVIIGSLLALILLVAAFMVFIYIPSKPENVFKTGLNRSGFIVKLISDQASKPENTKKLEKTAFKGTISYTGNDSSLSGTLDAKFNDTNAIAKLTGKYSEKGQPDKNLSVDTISTMDPNNPLPNIFIKIIGIKALQLDELIPGVGDYEGKWLTIDKSVWEKAGVNNEPSVNTKNMLTNEDTAQASKAIVDVTREYVLTANPKKAIFENRKFIGKEKNDGVTAHRYAVGF